MKKLLFSVGLLIIFPSTVQASLECMNNINSEIDKLQTEFLQQSASDLDSETQKSQSTSNVVSNLRKFRCELDKLCEGVENSAILLTRESTIDEQVVVSSFICKASYPQEEELFLEEKYLNVCQFQESDMITEINLMRSYCIEKKKNIFKKQSIALPEVSYEFSKQEEANYYSAKLLSITDRLNNLGDIFQKLSSKMKRVFKGISCRCE